MRTVLAHGTFDCLHIGHVYYLQDAAKLGDRLIVSITADRFVRKTPGRPVFDEHRRADMIRALRCVTGVYICNHETGVPAIETFRPLIYAKGPDYQAADHTGRLDLEHEAVVRCGGRLVIILTRYQCSSGEILSGRLLEAKRREYMKDYPHVGIGEEGVE